MQKFVETTTKHKPNLLAKTSDSHNPNAFDVIDQNIQQNQNPPCNKSRNWDNEKPVKLKYQRCLAQNVLLCRAFANSDPFRL
jgi:hypothetical protein